MTTVADTPTAKPTPVVYVGHLIGGAFGLAFILFNGTWLPGAWQMVLSIVGILVFVCVVAAFVITRRRQGAAAKSAVRFAGRYWLIVGIETILLFGGLAVVRVVEPAAVLGWIALVVGVHFLPLAGLWREGRSELLAIGTVMAVLGLIGLVLAFASRDGELVAFIAGVGSGVVLLGSSLLAALRTLSGDRIRP